MHVPLMSLLYRYNAIKAETDVAIQKVVVIGRVDREKVQGWVDDLKLIAVRTPVSNTRFVLTELQTIYRLLASGWSPESIDNYMIGVKRRYE